MSGIRIGAVPANARHRFFRQAFSAPKRGEGRKLFGQMVLLLAASVWALHAVEGADPVAGGKPAGSFNLVRLPAAEIAKRTNGNWRPVRWSELQRLLQESRAFPDGPQSVQISRAEYRAVFDGRSLRSGRLSLQIQHLQRGSHWLDLGRCNLALSRLEQENRPVLWGTDDQNRLRVRVDGKIRQLTGQWSLPGLPGGAEWRFPLSLIPAASSHLHLVLPAGWQLRTSAGIVRGPQPVENSGGQEWSVEVSRADRVTLRIERPDPHRQAQPLILLESDSIYVLRESGLHLQYQALLDVVEAPVREVVFRLPAAVDVYSVVYNGETPLPFTLQRQGAHRQLRVRLPDALLGKSRPLTLLAVAPFSFSAKPLVLPLVETDGGLFLNGQIHLRVEEPLQLKNYTTLSLRQITALSPQEAGESVSFQQERAAARLTVIVSRPDVVADCRAVTHLYREGERWRTETEMNWTVRSGQIFQARCRVSPGWNVTDIRLQTSAEGEKERSISWTEERLKNRQRLLTVFLPDAVTVGESVRLHLKATLLFGGRRQLRLPVLFPENSGQVQSAVLISAPPGTEAELLRGSGYYRIRTSDVPSFVAASKPGKEYLQRTSPARFILASRSPEPQGVLSLEQAGGAMKARVWVAALFHGPELEERVVLQITPGRQAQRSLLVHVSRRGASWNWKLRNKDGKPLSDVVTATPLPTSQFTGYDLPPGGELWELRWNTPLQKPFELSGTSQIAASGGVEPVLIFLPRAKHFEGFVSLSDAHPLEVKADAAFPADNRALWQARRPAEIPFSPQPRHLWKYQTPQARLRVTRRLPASTLISPKEISLELWSVLSPFREGRSLHRAVYRLAPQSLPGQFRFALPPQARLRVVTLNGTPVQPVQQSKIYRLESLPVNRAHVIEIRYSTPALQTSWTGRAQIAVPKTFSPLSGFRWHFALPPERALLEGPAQSTVRPLPFHVTWKQRLFGPLARSAEDPFEPFRVSSWFTSFLSRPSSASSTTNSPGKEGFPPSGWIVYEAESPAAPVRLSVRLLNRTTGHSLAWVVLLMCVTGGWLIRRSSIFPALYQRWGALWLSISLAAAWFVPPELAELAGGCLLGSLLAVLTPRRFLLREKNSTESPSDISPGSTASFPRRAVMTSLAVMLGCGAAGSLFARQEASQPAAHNGTERTSAPSSPAVNEPPVTVPTTVYLPAEGSRDDISSPVVVYVHRDYLKHLRKVAAQLRQAPLFLIRDAAYHIRVVKEEFAEIIATFVVDTPPVLRRTEMDEETRGAENNSVVRLPLAGAHLCGSDACRVDGRVQPVRRDAEGAFLVDLPAKDHFPPVVPRQHRPPAPPDTGDSQKKPVRHTLRGAGAERFLSSATGAVALAVQPARNAEEKWQRSTIRLCLRVPLVRTAEGDELLLGIPAVSSSRLVFTASRKTRLPAAEFLSEVEQTADSGGIHLSAVIGRRSQLRLRWLAETPQRVRSEIRPVATSAVVEVHPSYLRYRYHFQYPAPSQPTRHLDWFLPASWRVHQIHPGQSLSLPAENLSFHVITRTPGYRRVRVTLPDPPARAFVLVAEFIAPLPGQSFPLSLTFPRLHRRPLSRKGGNVSPDDERPFRAGFVSPSEYTLEVVPPMNAAIRQLDGPQREELRFLFSGSRLPLAGFEVSRPVTFRVRLLRKHPQRHVRQVQTVVIHPHTLRVEWQAEVTTETAPAFTHALILPDHFNVKQIEVLEDKAPRLVRWSRDGNRLILFLSDKTASTQTVRVQGEIPLRIPGQVSLPLLRFAAAEITDSRLLIYRHSEVGTGVLDAGQATLLAEAPSPLTDDNRFFVAAFNCNQCGTTPRLQVAWRNRSLSVRRLTVIRPSGAGRWQVHCTLQLQDDFPLTGLLVRIPQEIAGRMTLSGKDWRLVRRKAVGQSVEWKLLPQSFASPPTHLAFLLNDYRPEDSLWTVPLPVPALVSLREDYLLLMRGSRTLRLVSSVDRIAVAQWPKEVRELASLMNKEGGILYRNREEEWRFSANPEPRRKAGWDVPLLETTLWHSDGKPTRGRTVVWVRSTGHPDLSFRWPPNGVLQQVRVDGRLQEIRPADSDRLTIPLLPNVPHVLQLDWVLRPARRFPAIVRETLRYPQPLQSRIGRSLLVVSGPRGMQFAGANGAVPLNRVSHRLERMEQLIAWADHSSGTSSAVQLAWQTVRREEQALTTFFNRHPQTQATLSPAEKQRLEKIRTALAQWMQQLPSPSATTPGELPSFEDGSFPVWLPTAEAEEGRSVWTARVKDSAGGSPVQLWFVERSLLRGVVSFALLLVAVPLMLWVFRLPLSHLLARWDAICWGLWGLVWWFFLTPGWLGPIFLMVGILKAAVKWHARQRTKVIRLADASHFPAAK